MTGIGRYAELERAVRKRLVKTARAVRKLLQEAGKGMGHVLQSQNNWQNCHLW